MLSDLHLGPDVSPTLGLLPDQFTDAGGDDFDRIKERSLIDFQGI